MKKALACGAGGFVGHYMVRRLKKKDSGFRGVDLKYLPWCDTEADNFVIGDLRDSEFVRYVIDQNLMRFINYC